MAEPLLEPGDGVVEVQPHLVDERAFGRHEADLSSEVQLIEDDDVPDDFAVSDPLTTDDVYRRSLAPR